MALNINEVIPISEAASVRYPPFPKSRNDTVIAVTEKSHSNISLNVKMRNSFFFAFISTPHKKHPTAHLQRPNDVQSSVILSTRWQLFIFLYYISFLRLCQVKIISFQRYISACRRSFYRILSPLSGNSLCTPYSACSFRPIRAYSLQVLYC